MYQIPYHLVELIDPCIISIKASRWTEVASDDSLVQKLLQTCFTSEYPIYAFLHKDYLLKDMVRDVSGTTRHSSSMSSWAMPV